MRVSFNWLKDYVEFSLTVKQVADKLTMAGMEVEGLEHLAGDEQGLDDWALEINVTANRPDCLSVTGIAREVAAITRRGLKLPKAAVKETGEAIKNLVSIEVRDPELCPRYAGRVITGIKVGPSPAWMQRRLQAVGVRAINNVVDVTNYVLMELGHPLHAFDYGRLDGRMIIVRAAAEGEPFTTLDGVERKLAQGMLLICDGTRPVALAGVMGGQNSEVGDDTTDIFIESAYFDPVSVRRTSKRLGLHTEASHRFERGADPEGLIAALDRAAGLILELAGGKAATGRVDEYPKAITMPEVRVRLEKVNAVLGAGLEKKEVADILKRLKIGMKREGDGFITVQAPTFRPDLTREVDLVEEIARIHGYGKIRSEMPAYLMAPRTNDRNRDASYKVKEALLSLGYNEVINYSFINPADFDRIALPEDDIRRRGITVQNPLTVEQSVMRTTLVPSLLSNMAWNFTRGVRDLKFFELSKVFLSGGRPGLPEEPLRVAGLAAGSRTGSLWDGRDGGVDFFDIKGAVEVLLERLKIAGAVYRPAQDVPFLHPGKGAWLMVGGREAGFAGQVHPDVMARYDIPLGAYIFELDLQSLLDMGGEEPRYSPLPKYPSVARDIAVILAADIASSSVVKTIESLKIDLIEEVRLFDYYAGKPIPEGKKSLAYNITYRAATRTLTDEEVNEVHQGVVSALKDRLGAEIREQ